MKKESFKESNHSFEKILLLVFFIAVIYPLLTFFLRETPKTELSDFIRSYTSSSNPDIHCTTNIYNSGSQTYGIGEEVYNLRNSLRQKSPFFNDKEVCGAELGESFKVFSVVSKEGDIVYYFTGSKNRWTVKEIIENESQAKEVSERFLKNFTEGEWKLLEKVDIFNYCGSDASGQAIPLYTGGESNQFVFASYAEDPSIPVPNSSLFSCYVRSASEILDNAKVMEDQGRAYIYLENDTQTRIYIVNRYSHTAGLASYGYMSGKTVTSIVTTYNIYGIKTNKKLPEEAVNAFFK